MEKKTLKKLALGTLTFALIFGATRFQTTYAYFSDSNDVPLSYTAKLNNLYSENNMTLTKATFDDVKLQFAFELNKAVHTNETDQYEIKIPSSCTFDTVTTTGNVIDKDVHSKTISFEEGSKTSSVGVNLTCAIRVNHDLDFQVDVVETIASNQTLLYKRIYYKEGYQNYIKHIDQVVDSKPVPSTDLYKNLIEWLNDYNTKAGIQADIKTQVMDYVNTVFKDDTSIKNKENFNKLPGISISYDESKDEYTFNALDNLVGYARTYNHYKNAQAMASVYFYFSTTSRNALYQALLNYLDNYIYPTDKGKANMVYDYAYDNDIISSLMDGNFVAGWTLTKDENNPGNTMVRFTKGFIESDALSAKEKTPYVAFDQPISMLAKANGLVGIYYPDVAENIRTEIFNRTDITNSITRNNSTVESKESFKDYFVHKNGNQYLLIEVSSDLSTQPGYNKITMTPIDVPSTMTITLNNTNNNITVQISDTTKESVMKTLDDLNNYFKTSIREEDVTQTTLGNQYVIEYTITK